MPGAAGAAPAVLQESESAWPADREYRTADIEICGAVLRRFGNSPSGSPQVPLRFPAGLADIR